MRAAEGGGGVVSPGEEDEMGRRAGLIIGVVLAMGAALGACGGESAAVSDAGLAELIHPPETLAELTDRAELIAVGTVTRLLRQEIEEFSSGDGPDAPRSVSFPFAYYEVELEEIIWSDGDAELGTSIVIRVAGLAERDIGLDGRIVMPRVGDRRLFVLRRHFDGVSYGVDTFHILNLAGEVVTFGDRDRTPIDYLTEQSAPTAFLGQLRALYGE